MNCKEAEQFLYLSADGIAGAREEALAKEHCGSCAHCRELLAHLRRLKDDAVRVPDFPLIPEGEIDRMVTLELDRRRRQPVWTNPWPAFFKTPVAAFSTVALAVALCGVVILTRPHHDNAIAEKGVAARIGWNGQSVNAASRDTTLIMGPSCSALLLKHSVCTVLRTEKKVAVIDLQQGNILIAAKKGSYDTIAVYAGQVRVYATGTHFKVFRGERGAAVSVLEGTVRVENGDQATGIPLCAFQTRLYGNGITPEKTQTLTAPEQREMTNEFAEMSAANTRFELAGPTAAGHPEKPVSGEKTAAAACADDSACTHQYAIARDVMQKKNYRVAEHVLEDYLKKYPSAANADSAWFDLAYCYTVGKRYNDAVAAYRRSIETSVDDPLCETALHRGNKILFLKLGRTDEALSGFSEYLARYPHGQWRDEEWYYGVKAALALKDTAASLGMAQLFLKEFPKNCKAKELFSEARALRADGNRNPAR
jgi:TolA-binding protein